MEIILVILQLLIIFGGWFIYRYLKLLPEQVHQKNLKSFELDLNKQLESFKNDLTKELELIKINESQLHIHKTEEFNRLVEFIILNMLDKDYVAKLGKNQATQKDFNKKMLELGTKLFFFASDETVKKFVEWRIYGQNADDPNFNPMGLIEKLAELMVLIRKDLGYRDTICDTDDFLHIILTDWKSQN